MPRILIAALALACVYSPAHAISLGRITLPHAAPFSWSTFILGVVAAGLAVGLMVYAARRSTLPNVRDGMVLAGAMLGLFVAFPALAADACAVQLSDWPWYVGFAALCFAYVAFDIWRTRHRIAQATKRERARINDLWRSRGWCSCIACGAAALVLVGAFPAFAAEVATVGDTAVILPWGDYLVATAQMAVQIMLPVILPALAAAVIAALAKVAPWATLFLSQRRLEQMGQALADYGLNAVQGAAKGKTLSVDVGSRVIAAGVNYGLEKVPPKVVEAAGGAEGLAKIIFRLVSFDDRATASAVIPAALEKLHLPSAVIEHPAGPGRFPPPTPDELRDAERMSGN